MQGRLSEWGRGPQQGRDEGLGAASLRARQKKREMYAIRKAIV